MRFHVGFSFRLKTLKKFLIPFLIGILAYFGFGSILNVHAYENTNTGYYLNYVDYDFDNLSYGDYSFDDVWDLLTGNSEHYFVVLNMNRQGYINVYFIPKSQNGSVIYAFARGNVSDFFMNSSNAPTGAFQLMYPIGSTFDSTRYDAIHNCLYENTGCNNYSYFTSSLSSLQFNRVTSPSGINNNNSYTWSLPQDVFTNQYESYMFLYSNYEYIRYQYLGSGNMSSSTFYKSIYLNDTLISNNDRILAYCDFVDCSTFGNNVNPQPPYLEWFDEPQRVPRLYIGNIPKANINSVDYSFYFDYFDINFVDSLTFNKTYYGRIDHGTYYSYEKINCTQTTEKLYDNTTDNSYRYHINNISCSSSLTNYDEIFIYLEPWYDGNTNANINYYYSSLSGGGHDNYYFGDENFSIVEYFTSLPSDFNILLSTNDNLSRATFTSDNNYIFGAKVDRNNNKISSLVANQVESFGSYDNTSLMIYNFKPQNNNTTNFVNIFFTSDTILSVGNNGSYTYYDSSNNIVTGNIDNNYQNYTDNSYDLNYYFDEVNEFLRDINNDLYEFHNIFENVFSLIPSFLQLCIIVFYILLMTYLLFKFIRS